MDVIERGPDGYHHPSTEEEIRALVLHARATKQQLRVRGSTHSVAQSIYTDGYEGTGAPSPGHIDVMLDRFRAIRLSPIEGDPDHAIVEVEAGCNLGKNPYDPTHTSTWENSLDYFLQKNGWALDDLGGISHQTVSGFLATGSSGGSVIHSIDDNLVRVRFVDGTGEVHDVSRDDPDAAKRDLFFAAGVSMGLLGVVTKIGFRVRRTYNLFGTQVTTSTDACAIDLFGDGTADKPSLEQYLRETPYSRLMWWPQHGFERIQVWQATRMAPMPGFTPNPYLELGRAPRLASLAGSLFYTILGNLEAIDAVPEKLQDWYVALDGALDGAPDINACSAPDPSRAEKHTVADVLAFLRGRLESAFSHQAALRSADSQESRNARALVGAAKIAGASSDAGLPGVLALAITKLVELILDGALESPLAQPLADVLAAAMPFIVKDVLAPFVSDGTVVFWDTWMCGLPMDNQMDDHLWPTWFTELWIPIGKTAEVMQALRKVYSGGGDPVIAYEHTGAFSCELYAARKSDFWMSPSYGEDVFRVDVFWFAKNAGSPSDDFYPRFWEALAPFGFRPHWGKIIPPPSAKWAAYYRANLPRLGDFLALRDRLDPDRVFLTEYWRKNLGIA